MATRPTADQPSMVGYDPDLGLGDKVPTSVSNAITKRVGKKRVPRKTAPKPKAKTNLIRSASPISTPTRPITGAQGNANSTSTGVDNDAMMVAAKKLLKK